jgi:hypothetical protein
MDLEREQVISEWGCVKDGVDIPMSDVCCDTKSAQMEQRSTFLAGAAQVECSCDLKLESA